MKKEKKTLGRRQEDIVNNRVASRAQKKNYLKGWLLLVVGCQWYQPVSFSETGRLTALRRLSPLITPEYYISSLYILLILFIWVYILLDQEDVTSCRKSKCREVDMKQYGFIDPTYSIDNAWVSYFIIVYIINII